MHGSDLLACKNIHSYYSNYDMITCSYKCKGGLVSEGCQVASCTTFLFTKEASLFDSSSPKQE